MEFPADFRLFLASQSPRRHSLLSELGIPYTVVESAGVERMSGGPVTELASANALAKVHGAQLPGEVADGAFVLGTDTLVSVGRRVLGKPSSAEEAAQMLSLLAGRKHRVVSGVALARVEDGSVSSSGLAVSVSCATTEVSFATLDTPQILAYIDTGEWKGKAGGYAVQGIAALFVRSLKGEYSNVVGLPLHLTQNMFAELGFDLVRRTWLKDGDS